MGEVISFFDGQPLEPEVIEAAAKEQARTFNPALYEIDGGRLHEVGWGPMDVSDFETLDSNQVLKSLRKGTYNPGDETPF